MSERPKCQTCGKRKAGEFEFTCADCVSKTRVLIDTIERLSAKLTDEAAEQGRATSEVVMLAGAVADPVAYRQRRNYGYRDHWERNRQGEMYRPDVIGEEHPHWTLGTWDLLVREALGHKTHELSTIANCAEYLRDNLWLLARDPDFGFNELKDDVSKCAAHLEDVLNEGDRPERGMPCMYDGRVLTRDTELRFVKGKLTAVQSHWACSKCDRTWDEDQYARMQEQAWLMTQVAQVSGWVGMLPVLVEDGADTWCSVQHAAQRVKRSEGCVKGWASKHEWDGLCLIVGRRRGFVRLAQVVEHAEQAQRRTRAA